VQVYLKKRNATEDTVEAEVQRYREERRKNVKQEDSEVHEVMNRVRASRPAVTEQSRNDDVDEDDRLADPDSDDNEGTRNVPQARGGRGRGSRGGRGRGGVESNRRVGRGRGGRDRAGFTSAEPTGPMPSSSSRGGRSTRSIKDAFSAIPSSYKRSAS